MVRSQRELKRVLKDIEASPGIVLYTIFNKELAEELERFASRCHDEMLMGRLVKKPVEELVMSVNNKSLFIETVKVKAGLMKEV